MDPVDPIVLTKNVQATCDGLIETAGCNFSGMFHAARVETGYSASSKRHAEILALRFSFAKSLTFLVEKV
jgi:hypothetical protein